MRPTPVTRSQLIARRGAPWFVPLVASAVVFCSGLGSARADARGACVETSALSAPMVAPLALDEHRAAWVAGTLRLADTQVGVPSGRGDGGHPAWCEDGNEPMCDAGSEAPTRDERANSSDAGATLLTQVAGFAAVDPEKPGHPPIGLGSGPAGQVAELERPPKFG